MKEILPIVMNTSYERLAVIDDYISFIWTTRYYTCGDFELCVDVSVNNIALFQKDYFIVRDDDENVGVIEKLVIQRNDDGQEMLIVTGRFLASIIGRRIISRQTQINGTVSNGIYALLSNEVINPQNSARRFPNMIYQPNITLSEKINAQYTGKNLLDTIADICLTYGIGFKMIFNESNQFVFQIFEGTDRSYDQSVNPYIVFSDTYDNLLSSEYEENYENLVTDVLVAGEGEGLDRTMLWVSNNNDRGLNRYEMFKDRRDLQTNDGEVSEEEYKEQLQEAGEECLTQFTAAFTGTVYFDNVEYRKDVFVGDICTIENSRWGIYINSRLVEVIESVAESGEYSIVPTFGV